MIAAITGRFPLHETAPPFPTRADVFPLVLSLITSHTPDTSLLPPLPPHSPSPARPISGNKACEVSGTFICKDFSTGRDGALLVGGINSGMAVQA
ncbi:hypothetical protein E2C01_019303 [Portunus trituberculatus]|uniref:Uncharacterized protein n=1 Tax=Portunus trituberculatus TaxID=210409 RepID=A0A5B7DX81_PORTR|nr:hypothetical protein [Portunus trituberculatus]